MDRKNMIIAIVLMMALVTFWVPITDVVGGWFGYDMKALRRAAQEQARQTSTPSTSPSTSPPAASPSTAATTTGQPTLSAPALSAIPATQPASVTLGSAEPSDPHYPLAMQIAPEGAGLTRVILNDFKQSVKGKERYTFQQPYKGFEAQSRPLATRSVTINGTSIDIANTPWTLIDSSENSATYAVDLAAPSGAIARLVKNFNVYPRNRVDAGSGYELLITQTVENRTDRPIEVSMTVNGPTTPDKELDRGSDRSIVGGYDAGNKSVYVGHHYVEEFTAKQPRLDYTKHEKHGYPLLWAGVSSVYFNALLRPEPLGTDKTVPPDYIEKVEVVSLRPEAATPEAYAIAMTIQTKPLTVAPGGSVTLPSRAFFGPKQRSLLKNSYYALFPRSFDTTLVMTSGPCAVCTFQWLINILVGMLKGFYFVFRDWGIAIIILVCVVRLLLHPITKSSQKSMMKMGKMGPEIERLKKKYGEDKDALNREMMKVYKEQGFTPILGCLPMFLQMPIWIALWSALQSTFELRHASFLYGFTWIDDLAQPDHLIEFSRSFNLFGLLPISGLNVLPLLMGVVFYLQQKYTPKPPTMTPEQEQQQKIMQWMTLLFPLMLYAGPSGLNLYILTSTTIGIIESKVIRDHIKRDEEAQKEGRVIVDAKPTRASKRKHRDDLPPDPKAKTGLAGWLAALQEKADRVQREAQRKGRG
jgi:YidC/Oxa1 family membrane protein insertase